MTRFSEIHRQVLNTLKSNTLAAMEDYDIELMLNDMIIRAVANFRYPKIALSYSEILDDNETVELTFDNTLTQKEINVILALVKVAWLEQQLDNETNFENVFYDRDVKVHSRGNLVKSIQERYAFAKEEANSVQYNYYRVSAAGAPAVKDIYDQ